ncbi:MAG TPA: glucans biosynthesis glucosyltransferase MdoH [Methylomirabilota bacterium]|nr:glucans biosynthesis glucosyltransferase MdoH [Methylomirabilota bacterium]
MNDRTALTVAEHGATRTGAHRTRDSRRGGRSAPGRDSGADLRRIAMPEIRRASMVPPRLERHPLKRFGAWMRRRIAGNGIAHEGAGAAAAFDARWRRVARRRRLGLAALVVMQTTVAAWLLDRTFPYSSLTGLEVTTLAVFTVLWAWVSFGFWTAVVGFVVRWRNATRIWGADGPTAAGRATGPLRTRTAIVVPICSEDVRRVFAGVEATYRSLAATGHLEAFDVYILSDTRDPETQSEEALAWADVCDAVSGYGRIFYRLRKHRIKRKSGNIADFLRRWGGNYDHMIVCDADSVLAGATVVQLVRLMERHPRAGIIQTIPAMVNRETLFARVHQFASRVYGPMLAAGLHFWQLGESYYWGHNAIIRCAPFMKHCGLSRLPGEPPLGGEIMSHDFVEAALMGRAGWEVWLACDLDGSYEEAPPTLLDELKRDRRWCQGNLQHLRLLFADGIRPGHRAIMAMGVIAYTSSLLWAAFLVLSTLAVAEKWLTVPVYFTARHSLFPLWPQWRPELALALAGSTALLLVLPKLLSVLLIVRARRSAQFGSLPRLAASVLLEVVFSTLLAPVRMWFHAKFVVLTLLGRQIGWSAQVRTDAETRWRDAVRQHGISTVVALAWLGGIAALHWSLVWWLLPIVLALALSVPVSVYSSRVTLGRAFRRRRLFVTPEESRRPELLRELADALERPREPQPIATAAG